jgi:hypothetical protein
MGSVEVAHNHDHESFEEELVGVDFGASGSLLSGRWQSRQTVN